MIRAENSEDYRGEVESENKTEVSLNLFFYHKDGNLVKRFWEIPGTPRIKYFGAL